MVVFVSYYLGYCGYNGDDVFPVLESDGDRQYPPLHHHTLSILQEVVCLFGAWMKPHSSHTFDMRYFRGGRKSEYGERERWRREAVVIQIVHLWMLGEEDRGVVVGVVLLNRLWNAVTIR